MTSRPARARTEPPCNLGPSDASDRISEHHVSGCLPRTYEGGQPIIEECAPTQTCPYRDKDIGRLCPTPVPLGTQSSGEPCRNRSAFAGIQVALFQQLCQLSQRRSKTHQSELIREDLGFNRPPFEPETIWIVMPRKRVSSSPCYGSAGSRFIHAYSACNRCTHRPRAPPQHPCLYRVRGQR